MVSVVKSEWHQVEKRYGAEIDTDLLSEIYPDLDEDEIEAKLAELASGEETVDTIINDAWDNDVEIAWDYLNEDDWWTDRKGGYEVTYEMEEWEVREDYVSPITHKCVKCKWTGSRYDADWKWEDDEGNHLEEAIKVCPMCDSATELTEVGIAEEKKDTETKVRWPIEDEDEEDEALEELKRDFDALSVDDEETEVKTPVAEWPFSPDDIITQTDTEVLPNYPAGEYTIRIWGRTREIGVGKITKQQYEHWSHEDHEDDLSDAMNENYDYDENDTPKKARFDSAYYEYQDVHSIWGFDEDDTVMTVTDSNGEEIFKGDLSGFIGEAHGDNDSRWEATEEVDEMYPDHLGKGYFVVWTQGGKGSCIQTTIDTDGEEFDPRKLKYTTWDIEGSSIVNRLSYDGSELDDYGMDSEHDNWRGQWSQFNVYHNKK